jgi:hypothetical protein
MPIDASIPLQAKLPQFDSPVNGLARLFQIKGLQQQQEMGELQAGELKRGVEENRLLNEAYKSALSPDGKTDRNKLFSTLATSGLGAKIPAIRKGLNEEDAALALKTKNEIEAKLKKIEVAGQIISGVKDQATWEIARQQTAEMFGPEAAAQMPAQYDPVLVEQKRRQAMPVKDQLEQEWKKLDHALKVEQFGEVKRHNGATEGLTAQGQKITLRGQDVAAETARRGQNMANERSREANALKLDENNIKRTEKKEVADLTKSSQVASFDTMLGTLDRLSTHPGLSRSVGFVGAFPTAPGTDSANFQAELNTFQSQAFIPMVAQLKGMGALSDAEGKKLTAAVGALDPKMGEKAFRESVSRIIEDMETARERVSGQRRAPGKAPANPTGNAPASGGLTPAEQAELQELRKRLGK